MSWCINCSKDVSNQIWNPLYRKFPRSVIEICSDPRIYIHLHLQCNYCSTNCFLQNLCWFWKCWNLSTTVENEVSYFEKRLWAICSIVCFYLWAKSLSQGLWMWVKTMVTFFQNDIHSLGVKCSAMWAVASGVLRLLSWCRMRQSEQSLCHGTATCAGLHSIPELWGQMELAFDTLELGKYIHFP